MMMKIFTSTQTITICNVMQSVDSQGSDAAIIRKLPFNTWRFSRGSIVPGCTLPNVTNDQWLKWFCEAGGAHLTRPGWSKPHTHSNPTNLASFRHKMTLYRFNQGALLLQGGLKWEQGGWPPSL